MGVALGVMAVVLVSLALYLLLFAPILANHERAIPARREFAEQILERRLLLRRLPCTAYARDVTQNEKNETVYEYAMMGRLEKINTHLYSFEDERAGAPILSPGDI